MIGVGDSRIWLNSAEEAEEKPNIQTRQIGGGEKEEKEEKKEKGEKKERREKPPFFVREPGFSFPRNSGEGRENEISL